MELDPTVSPNVSANSWLMSVGQQLTDCRWTVGRLLGDKATNNENTNHALVMSPPCVNDVLGLCMFTFSNLFNILRLMIMFASKHGFKQCQPFVSTENNLPSCSSIFAFLFLELILAMLLEMYFSPKALISGLK